MKDTLLAEVFDRADEAGTVTLKQLQIGRAFILEQPREGALTSQLHGEGGEAVEFVTVEGFEMCGD